MGIFKNITRALKKAAPVIGSAIGMYIGGPVGASIGSGIGSLAAGKDAEEALRNAALAGATTYAMGGKGFGKHFNFDTSGSPFASGSSLPTQYGSGSMATGEAVGTGIKQADTSGIGSFLKSMVPESTAGKIALGGAGLGLLGALGGEEEKTQDKTMRDYPVGQTRLGYGRIGNKLYNLDNKEERKQYFEDNRNRDIFIDPMVAAAGGEVEGPGTGTSDSVPARLSDGEFVMTAKAVRGAGGGDRNVGAARMYDIMSQLERVA